MASVLIVYGSSTGNTKKAAELVDETLRAKGFDVTLKDVVEADVSDLTNGHSAVFLGCSTWGAIEEEVQEDFLPLYEAMDGVSLKGVKVAVFGSGDTGYAVFCKAVDAVEEKVRERGAALLVESLKIDGKPDWAEEDIRKWVERAISKVS